MQEIFFPMIKKTSVFCQKMPEKTVVKDAYSPKKINKAVAVIWDNKSSYFRVKLKRIKVWL